MYNRTIHLSLGMDGQLTVSLEVTFTWLRFPPSFDDQGDSTIEIDDYTILEVTGGSCVPQQPWTNEFISRWQPELEHFIDNERDYLEELCADSI